MREVWASWGNVLVVWAIGLPVAAAVAALLIRWRLRRGVSRPEALRRTAAEAGIVIGTVPWMWMILTPIAAQRSASLIPLRDLLATLTDSPSRAVVQVGANLIVFLPLGFLVPLRFPRLAGVLPMLALGAALSATLETAQYVLELGRISSVDDVLMNAAGAGVGGWLATVHTTRRDTGRAYSTRMLHRLGWAT